MFHMKNVEIHGIWVKYVDPCGLMLSSFRRGWWQQGSVFLSPLLLCREKRQEWFFQVQFNKWWPWFAAETCSFHSVFLPVQFKPCQRWKLGFTAAGSGATGSSLHAVVDESFAHVLRPWWVQNREFTLESFSSRAWMSNFVQIMVFNAQMTSQPRSGANDHVDALRTSLKSRLPNCFEFCPHAQHVSHAVNVSWPCFHIVRHYSFLGIDMDVG